MQANREILRRFLAAAMCDLVGYLDTMGDPIIVGGSYPKDLLVQRFNRWCKSRNFSVVDADIAGWLEACKVGSLNTLVQKEGDSDAST